VKNTKNMYGKDTCVGFILWENMIKETHLSHGAIPG